MSNYVKATDFASKDALLTGDPLKIVSGTEINDELNAIQTAVNTKANINSPTLTGAPTSPTASAGASSTQIATTAFVTTALTNYNTVVDTLLQALYPVGTIYTNATDGTNPATLVGFGTWSAFGTGRVLVAIDSGNTLMDAAEETGGSADTVVIAHNHTLTDPGHIHSVSGTRNYNQTDDRNGSESTRLGAQVDTDSATTGITLASAGVAGTDLNYQPFITVYYWKRTA
jgi:hypothetical protein